MVDFHEVFVFGKRLLVGVQSVYVGRGIVVIDFIVYEGFHWQSVRLVGMLIGIAHSDRSHRHDKLRELQGVNEDIGLINCSSQVTDAQPFFFGKRAECLCI